MAKKHTVAVGMNVGTDDVRYERGDSIPAKSVEQWMLDDGLVVEGDLPTEADVITEHIVNDAQVTWHDDAAGSVVQDIAFEDTGEASA